MLEITPQNFFSYKHTIGNKAYNLFLMQKAGIQTPSCIVLSHIDWSCKEEVIAKLQQIINTFSSHTIILRSSGNLEDGNEISFAGILTSLIIHTKHNLHNQLDHAFDTFKTTLDSTILSQYATQNNITLTEFRLNIIIQEYVEAQYGGVVFSSDPRSPDKGMLVNISYKGPQEVVEGQSTIAFHISHIYKKQNKRDKHIYKTVIKIRQLFRQNVDVEFLFTHQNKLIILQARRAHISKREKCFLADSSNIQENLPFQLLPLTLSFLERMYENTYYNLIAHSVGYKKTKKFAYLFQNLILFINGYVYYNIGNWYNFTRLLPFSSQNNQSLKEMIGGKVNPNQIIDDSIDQMNIYEKCIYIIKLIYKLLTFPHTVKDFQSRLQSLTDRYAYIDFSQFDLYTLEKIFHNINSEIEPYLHINAENDFILMHLFNWIKKRNPRYREILNYINKQHAFASKQTRVPHIHNLDDYIKHEATFLGRIPLDMDLSQELSLPDIDLSLQNDTQTSLIQSNPPSQTKQGNAVNMKLSFIETQFKTYLLNREKHRLFRSQLFHIYRKLFTQIGVELFSHNIINHTKDVHYLTVEEIIRILNYRSIDNIKELVQLRKKEYSRDTTPNESEKLCIAGIFYFNKIDKLERLDTENGERYNTHTNRISGEVCSFGEHIGELGKDILLVKHVSPGDVINMAQYKGLLIVHGGLLSHGAILARELHIPALINLDNNWKKLENGQKVYINANQGYVEIISN